VAFETLTRLAKIRIEEVSGVDFPATELDGFMVMKARASGEKLFRVHVGGKHEVFTLAEIRQLDAAVVTSMESIEKSITVQAIIDSMTPDQLDAVLATAARERCVETGGEAEGKKFDKWPRTPIRPSADAVVATEKAKHNLRHRYSGKFVKPSEAEPTMTSGVLPGEARRGAPLKFTDANKQAHKQGRALWGSSGLGVVADGPPVVSGGSLSAGFGDQGAT
jgi:hypothetical protein